MSVGMLCVMLALSLTLTLCRMRARRAGSAADWGRATPPELPAPLRPLPSPAGTWIASFFTPLAAPASVERAGRRGDASASTDFRFAPAGNMLSTLCLTRGWPACRPVYGHSQSTRFLVCQCRGRGLGMAGGGA